MALIRSNCFLVKIDCEVDHKLRIFKTSRYFIFFFFWFTYFLQEYPKLFSLIFYGTTCRNPFLNLNIYYLVESRTFLHRTNAQVYNGRVYYIQLLLLNFLLWYFSAIPNVFLFYLFIWLQLVEQFVWQQPRWIYIFVHPHRHHKIFYFTSLKTIFAIFK